LSDYLTVVLANFERKLARGSHLHAVTEAGHAYGGLKILLKRGCHAAEFLNKIKVQKNSHRILLGFEIIV